MSWRFDRSRFALDLIASLPLEAQLDFFDLISRLEDNPDATTEPYGLDAPGPIRMRSTGVGNVIAVFIVNDTTEQITLVQITG